MHWIVDAFWARIGWALGEITITMAVVLTVVVLMALFSVPRIVRQARCKHTRYFETGACDAVCTDCGRNLGFIGTWRKHIAAHPVCEDIEGASDASK